MNAVLLTLLAHLSAHRRLLINAYVCGFLDEPEPTDAACALRQSFADRPTQAPESGSSLDPAVSDLLAAMTDEAIDDFMERVLVRLRQLQDATEDIDVIGGGLGPLTPALARRGA
jgi:hypothetical protein